LAEQADTGKRRRGTRDTPPETVQEALARARGHSRAAAAEALAALRSLLDAASLAAAGTPAKHNRGLAALTRLLDDLSTQLGSDTGLPESLVTAIAEAVDVEIARWEQRAREDANARAVLRAFLGLREVLWEFGVKASEGAEGEDKSPGSKSNGPGTRRRPRVQRVRVEG